MKTYNNGSHTYSYTYDAENRLSTVDTTAGVYTYDAEGRRIRRVVSGAVSDYLYDLGGHAMTEVSSTGTWTRGEVFLGGRHLATYAGGAGGTTNFAFTDWLGTERARTQVNGTRCETIVSLAFGDGQVASGSCDPTPLHFTGKERDSESGLDDFGARFYSSSIGRFMQVDEFTGGPIDVLDPSPSSAGPLPYADIFNPQSLNKYAYTYNNPLRYIDPNGHDAWDIVKGSGETVIGFGAVVVGAASSEVGVGVPIALGGVALMGKGAIDLGKGIDPKLDTKDAEAGVQVVTGKNGLPDPVGVIGTAVTGDIQKGAKAADTVNKVADAGKAVKDAVKDPSKVGEAAKKVSSAVKAVTQVVNGAKQYVTVPPPPPPPPAPKCTSDGKCH